MPLVLSNNTRLLVIRTWPRLVASKDQLVGRMRQYLLETHPGRPPEEAALAASLLFAMLVSQAAALESSTGGPDFEAIEAELSGQGIDQSYRSRFGDALVPIMRGALEPAPSERICAAWIDFYWAILRKLAATQSASEGRAA